MPYDVNVPVYVGGYATMAAGAGLGYAGLDKLNAGNEQVNAAKSELAVVRAQLEIARHRLQTAEPALFGPDSPAAIEDAVRGAESRVPALDDSLDAGRRTARTGGRMLAASVAVLLGGMTLGLSGADWVDG